MATEKEVVQQQQQQLQPRMSELASALPREIGENRSKVDHVAATFRHSIQLVRAKVDDSIADQEQIRKLNDELKELENDLSRVLSAKACKEVKHKNKEESLFNKKTRITEVKKIVQDKRARKEKLAALLSKKFHALETLKKKNDQDDIDKENIETALLWYRKVLGFRTEGGEGVKFFFNKIDQKDADKEFSFTVRLEGDTYRLLQCNPVLQDTTELVKDLNQTNGFFKFVRAMREKFLAYALNESTPAVKDICQDSSTITVSSPPPVSEDNRGGSLTEGVKDDFSFPTTNMHSSRSHQAKSPKSVSATRRSPRFQRGA